MHIIITFLLTFFMMVFAFLTIGREILHAYGGISMSWAAYQERIQAKAETRIAAPLGQTAVEGANISLSVVNEGREALGGFESWDALIEWHSSSGLNMRYLAYTTDASPAANEWTVQGIYLDADTLTAEIIDPGILNPGEEMVVTAHISPSALSNTYARAVFVTPNGVTLEIIFEVLATLYVLDETDSMVYRYLADGTYLGSNVLNAANTSARGITTDNANFWTTDWVDDEAYKYNSAFALDSTWGQAVLNKHGVGITTDGTNIWVVDEVGLKVFKYDMDGDLDVGLPNFALNLNNADPTGITTDGSSIWITDVAAARAYKYEMDGDYLSEFDLDDDNADPSGITTDGTYLWVVDNAAVKVFKYALDGTYLSEFSLTAANADPQGITVRSRLAD